MIKDIDGERYYRNPIGGWIPEDQVKDTDKLRDQLVTCIAEKLLDLRQEMIKVKADVIEDIDAFMQTMSEEYGVKLGGDKGNLTFTSYDGSIRVQYYNNDYLTFNEGIHVAKELIDEYLNDVTRDSSPAIKQIVQAAFNMKQGRMDVKAILKLREIKEDDPRWLRAMQIIDESKQWNSSRRSLRLYLRSKRTGELENLPLDFSSIMAGTLPTDEQPAPPAPVAPEGDSAACASSAVEAHHAEVVAGV